MLIIFVHQMPGFTMQRKMLSLYSPTQHRSREVQRILADTKDFLAPLIAAINDKHPRHVHQSLAILITDKKGERQRIHSDFDCDATIEDCKHNRDMPFSVVVPLNVCRSLNVVLPPATTSEYHPVTVHPRSFMLFRGDVLHGGAANPLNQYAYSVHIYFGVSQAHIPVDEVFSLSASL
jgi:hypothetical protein